MINNPLLREDPETEKAYQAWLKKQEKPASTPKTGTTQIPTTLQGIIIDEQTADNGTIKTQVEWINYFNERKRIMMSAPDLYHATKNITPELLQSLQQDFINTLTTSTLINYKPDSLEGTLTHHYGSTVIKPQTTSPITIPENLVSIENVLESPKGLQYLQALFRTTDSPEQITKTLEKLLATTPDKIIMMIDNRSERPPHLQVLVAFYSVHSNEDNLSFIAHMNFPHELYRSRGVIYTALVV